MEPKFIEKGTKIRQIDNRHGKETLSTLFIGLMIYPNRSRSTTQSTSMELKLFYIFSNFDITSSLSNFPMFGKHFRPETNSSTIPIWPF